MTKKQVLKVLDILCFTWALMLLLFTGSGWYLAFALVVALALWLTWQAES